MAQSSSRKRTTAKSTSPKATGTAQSKANTQKSEEVKAEAKSGRKVSVSTLKNIVPASPAITKAAESKVGSTFGGFMTFMRQQGVVGLAVGIVLGGAVTVVVRSLIDNIVMPPLGYILGSAEGLDGVRLYIGRTGADNAETYINIGSFLNDFINFAIIAVVVYVVVHLLRLDKLDKPKS
jgi:large conductance mechanosensitive channel